MIQTENSEFNASMSQNRKFNDKCNDGTKCVKLKKDMDASVNRTIDPKGIYPTVGVNANPVRK